MGARGLDAFTLKIVALAAMTVDHVGALLYPEALWLRVIGRLAMPIIAFLLLVVVSALVFVGVSAGTGDNSYAVINAINLGCALALPLLRGYDGRRGRDFRYFFYAYYPAHLLALCAIRALWF